MASNERLIDVYDNLVQPLLTDLYQITMAYAYWKNGKRNDKAVFDLFFRKNPFCGEFTIFAGLEQCVGLLQRFSFASSDIEYIRSVLPEDTDPEFFSYLKEVDASKVALYSVPEGTVVFPRVPLMRIEGPLPVVQLLETSFLTLINYASLVATNAARFRLAAGPSAQLLEFGLRRAQGPDGGVSASKYCYIGGFNSTSNVLAGKIFSIPVVGTHAHAFVSSFSSIDDLPHRMLAPAAGSDSSQAVDFLSLVLSVRLDVCRVLNVVEDETKEGELAAFVAYAIAFPVKFLALVDTYDIIRSGLPNFCCVAIALCQLGYKPIGVRIDSGDLAYLSLQIRRMLRAVGERFSLKDFGTLNIVASNDINEDTIYSLENQGHSINSFGIGTHLVTCQKQPALGCVFKLVELNGKACMKLSQDVQKVTLPGKKNVYRLFGHDGCPLVDLLMCASEPEPKAGVRVLCRHPFQESHRAYVNPAKVEALQSIYWENGKSCGALPSLTDIRTYVAQGITSLRDDHKRSLNPTPYKVSVSVELYQFLHQLWLEYAPIGELS